MCSRQFTDNDIEILMILSDDEGHPQWEVAKITGIAKSNLSPIIKKLKDENVVYEGDPRQTTNKKSRRPNTKEYPLYVIKDIEVYNAIMANINLRIEDNFDYMNYVERIESNYPVFHSITREKLALDRKGPFKDSDLDKRIDEILKVLGCNRSDYKEKYEKYLDYIEKVLCSRYVEQMINEVGFGMVFNVFVVVGWLDIWYKEKLIEIASDKNLICKRECEEFKKRVYH